MSTYFTQIKSPIAYEGPTSRTPLAFKWYDANRLVRGKTMAEHFRFAVAFWHTFKGNGSDRLLPKLPRLTASIHYRRRSLI